MCVLRIAACLATCCVLALLHGAVPVFAQQGDEKRTKGWSNSTELSLAVTEGNSNTDSFAVKNTLGRIWERGRLKLTVDSVRTNTSDDWERHADSGFTWLPGELPPEMTTNLVKPAKEPDLEKYLVEARYEREITETFTWNTGARWDRDVDAGILNRYIGYGGVGNRWWDRDDLAFSTSYGFSITDREEEAPDPEKDDRFMGVRLTSDFSIDLGKTTTYGNVFTGNLNLKDSSDYSLDMTNQISVNINGWLALKTSLQWLYNREPALEDIDYLAIVVLRDPDGVPGTGDEFFETVTSGGTEIVLGEVRERKEKLDTVFRTTLVINF